MESEFSLLKSPFKSRHFRQDSTKNFNLKKKKEYEWKIHRDFLHGTMDRNPPVDAGDIGLIPGPGRFHMLWSD